MNAFGSNLEGLRSALNGITCASVRKQVQDKIDKIVELDRKQAQACADERSRMNAFGGDLEGLRSALGGFTCASVRKDAQDKVAELEAAEARRKQAQFCADERSRIDALGGNVGELRSALELKCAGAIGWDRHRAQVCADERSRIDALGGNLDGLRSALPGVTCAGVLKEVQDRIAELEVGRHQAQACADERSRIDALGGNLDGLRSALDGLTCASVRKDAQDKVAALEADRKICAGERSRMNGLGGDLEGLRAAVDGLTCADVRKEVQRYVTELLKQAQACADERSRIEALGGNLDGLRSALDGLTCAAVRNQVQDTIAEWGRKQAQVCAAEHGRFDALALAGNLEGLRSVVDGITCASVQKEVQGKIADLTRKIADLEAGRKQAQVCADERSRMNAFGNNLDRLRSAVEGLTCAVVRKEVKDKIAALEPVRKQAHGYEEQQGTNHISIKYNYGRPNGRSPPRENAESRRGPRENAEPRRAQNSAGLASPRFSAPAPSFSAPAPSSNSKSMKF